MTHDLVNDPHNLFVPDPPKFPHLVFIPHWVFKLYDGKGNLVSETKDITPAGIEIPDGGSCTVLFGEKAVSFFTSEWGTVYLGDRNGNHC